MWAAGNEGERRGTSHLSSLLNDDWTLISGYRGPGGEIDQILVGSRGVCALETKYLNGTAFVSGDTWEIDKYDPYGNLVESGRSIEDRRGRSQCTDRWRGQAPGGVPVKTGLCEASQPCPGPDSRQVSGGQNRETARGLYGDPRGCDGRRTVLAPRPRLDRASAGHVVQRIQRDHEFRRKRSSRSKRYGRRRR